MSILSATTGRAPGPLTQAAPQEQPRCPLGFALFLLVNACLFVRPAEVVSDLYGVEIYQYVIITCFLFSFPAVLSALDVRRLERQPIALCVFALLPAAVLSLLANGHVAQAVTFGFDMVKTLVYVVLFLGLVTTPGRLRIFVLCLALFACGAVILSILDYHGAITIYKIPNPKEPPPPPGTPADPEHNRMVGTGLFQDPNDLCVLIVVGLIFSLYGLLESGRGRGVPWLAPLAVFGYGFALTQSRGGLLALLAGLAVLVRLRWGLYRLVVLGVLGVPVLFALLGARQTDIGANVATGQERVQLWSEGLMMFRGSPLFGVGMNHFTDSASHVAHNSYVHLYAELGFLGGTLFVGAVYLSVTGLLRLALPPRGQGPAAPLPDLTLARLHPFVAGAVTAYATGMLTLSLCYIAPTYTMLALAVAFLTLAGPRPWMRFTRFDSQLLGRLILVGLVALLLIQVAVRVLRRF